MAEGTSDDSLLNELLPTHFIDDLPDNPQTWLYCMPGDDPNIMVDLTSILKPDSIQQGLSSSQRDSCSIDTRTFTRPKKYPRRRVIEDSHIFSSPILESGNKSINSCIRSRVIQMTPEGGPIRASLNFKGNTYSENDGMNLTQRSLIEDTSYPEGFFDNSLMNESNIDKSQSILANSSSKSLHKRFDSVTSSPLVFSSKKESRKSIESHFSPIVPGSAISDVSMKFRGLANSTPNANKILNTTKTLMNHSLISDEGNTTKTLINHSLISNEGNINNNDELNQTANVTHVLNLTRIIHDQDNESPELNDACKTFIVDDLSEDVLDDQNKNTIIPQNSPSSNILSTENISKNKKSPKEKDDDSSPDSCYSSSSNIRSTGDIYSMAQQQEPFNSQKPRKLRKSISHESLIPSVFSSKTPVKKHESEEHLSQIYRSRVPETAAGSSVEFGANSQRGPRFSTTRLQNTRGMRYSAIPSLPPISSNDRTFSVNDVKRKHSLLPKPSGSQLGSRIPTTKSRLPMPKKFMK